MKKIQKKWLLFIITSFVSFFGIGYTLIKGTKAVATESLDEQINAVMETAFAYSRQGKQIQYDSYRKNNEATPEDATSQNTVYTVCSGFAYQVYYQTLGIKIPEYTSSLIEYAEKYKDNKEVVVFYYNEEELYSTDVLGTKDGESNVANLVEEWKNLLQSGDILVVQNKSGAGHAMLIDNSGSELMLLHSTGGRYNPSTLTDNYEENGTIISSRMLDMLENYRKEQHQTSFTIIRVLNDSSSYIHSKGQIKTYGDLSLAAKSRLDLPKIDIEKTIKLSNENSTYKISNIDETITYKLVIKNNSNSSYGQLEIVENIDSKTMVVDNGNGSLDGNKLSWTYSSLNSGEIISIEYTVKVENDKSLYGDIIVSTGKVNDIATSKIETLIGNKLTNDEKSKLIEVFNNLRSDNSVEKEFIDKIYLDSLDFQLDLNKFAFFDILSEYQTADSYDMSKLHVKHVKVNETRLKGMIYQNFYGLRSNGIISGNGNWNYYPITLYYDRARTIDSDMLETGDIILLHSPKDSSSSEMVDKAYIYIDNKLYRKVNEQTVEEISGNELVIFLRNIVFKNYVILKPSFEAHDSGKIVFDDSIIVDDNNKYIKYLSVGTSVSSFVDKITMISGNINVYDKDGNIKENDDIIATGDILRSYVDDNIIDEYQLSVIGDSNGDGKLSLLDLAQFRKHYVKWVNPNTGIQFSVTGVYEQAFDFNKDGRISIVDLAIMRKTEAGVI